MASVSLAGLGAVGYGTDGSTVVMGIDMVAALLWLLSYKSGPSWCVLLRVYPLTQWHLEQPPVQAEHECRRRSSVHGGFWKFFVFLQFQRALFALGNLCIISSWPRTLQSCVRCLGVGRKIRFFGRCWERNAWLDCGDMLCLSVA